MEARSGTCLRLRSGDPEATKIVDSLAAGLIDRGAIVTEIRVAMNTNSYRCSMPRKAEKG
jgi:hypothetical protein